MLINRRSFVLTGAALAASPLATLATPQAAAAPVEAVPLTAAEVVRRIQAHVGMPWMTTTVDRIVAGSPDTPVKAIATTMMATLDVLERAAADGRNMIITHEPTFYSHQDTTQDLLTDPTYRYKTDFIADHNLVVFRFHDHWHRMAPRRHQRRHDPRTRLGEERHPRPAPRLHLPAHPARRLRQPHGREAQRPLHAHRRRPPPSPSSASPPVGATPASCPI